MRIAPWIRLGTATAGTTALLAALFLPWTVGQGRTLAGYELANLGLALDALPPIFRVAAACWYAVPLSGAIALFAAALSHGRWSRILGSAPALLVVALLGALMGSSSAAHASGPLLALAGATCVCAGACVPHLRSNGAPK